MKVLKRKLLSDSAYMDSSRYTSWLDLLEGLESYLGRLERDRARVFSSYRQYPMFFRDFIEVSLLLMSYLHQYVEGEDLGDYVFSSDGYFCELSTSYGVDYVRTTDYKSGRTAYKGCRLGEFIGGYIKRNVELVSRYHEEVGVVVGSGLSYKDLGFDKCLDVFAKGFHIISKLLFDLHFASDAVTGWIFEGMYKVSTYYGYLKRVGYFETEMGLTKDVSLPVQVNGKRVRDKVTFEELGGLYYYGADGRRYEVRAISQDETACCSKPLLDMDEADYWGELGAIYYASKLSKDVKTQRDILGLLAKRKRFIEPEREELRVRSKSEEEEERRNELVVVTVAPESSLREEEEDVILSREGEDEEDVLGLGGGDVEEE